jgi:hypothetical protein
MVPARTEQRSRSGVDMLNQTRNGRRGLLLAMLMTAAATTGCGHVMTMLHGGPPRPPQSEFGLGPKPTAAGVYRVSLEPLEPLATRRLQKVRVRVLDAAGRAVEDAEITVDGGMPQHGHGLPTRPRMTGRVAEGVYEIDGVRFNMGGWWQFRLAITASAGADSITFNLDL